VPPLLAIFATGASGYGLLVLRLVLGASVVFEGAALLTRHCGPPPAAMLTLISDALLVLSGTLIGLGLLTSAMHAIIATVKLAGLIDSFWLLSDVASDVRLQLLIFQLAVAIGLLLIGPGAYSIDARIFGRQEIQIPPRSRYPMQ
jgi:hypothetical protein